MEDREEKKIIAKLSDDLETLERYIEEYSVFLPLAVITINPSRIVVDINQAAGKLTGLEEDDIIGQPLERFFKNKKEINALLAKSLEREIVRNDGLEMAALGKKSRANLYVSVSVAVRKDVEGNQIGMFVSLSDISELKELQQDLEEKVQERTRELERAGLALTSMLEDTELARKSAEIAKNKTKAILASLTDGLIVIDKNSKISLVNSEAERILNIKEKQLLGKQIRQALRYERVKLFYEALGKKIAWTGEVHEFVIKYPLKRYFQVMVHPVVVLNNEIGLMIVFHDITRDREIDRLKTEFVAIAAHQLRTPLSIVKWTLKMLIDGDIGKLTDEQIDYVTKGYQSNERMIVLVNDLLSVARIEEGRFIYKLTLFQVEDIFSNYIDSIKELTRKRGIAVDFIRPDKPLPLIRGDKEKVNLVVQNLVDNAVRYTPDKGRVTISLRHDRMNIEAMIKDNGIGIPEDQHSRIFTKFFRADNAVRTETEGTGLGLFIAKNILETHGGRIWFESAKGKGATFWFSLPIKKE